VKGTSSGLCFVVGNVEHLGFAIMVKGNCHTFFLSLLSILY
jgi:hypothetical protein